MVTVEWCGRKARQSRLRNRYTSRLLWNLALKEAAVTCCLCCCTICCRYSAMDVVAVKFEKY